MQRKSPSTWNTIVIGLSPDSYVLMQISSGEGDWVIDTLAVRDLLEELNEVFTNPHVVKVCPIFCSHETQVAHIVRLQMFTGHRVILYGFNKISIFTS